MPGMVRMSGLIASMPMSADSLDSPKPSRWNGAYRTRPSSSETTRLRGVDAGLVDRPYDVLAFGYVDSGVDHGARLLRTWRALLSKRARNLLKETRGNREVGSAIQLIREPPRMAGCQTPQRGRRRRSGTHAGTPASPVTASYSEWFD